MTRLRIPSVAVAVALAFGAACSPALAQNGQQRGQHGEREGQGEMAAVLAAQVNPRDAVTAAERSANGRALKLEMEHERGAWLYEVRVATGDQVVNVKIDPTSGAVRETEREGLVARLFEGRGIQALLQAPTGLGQAIAAAEQAAGGGRAVEAAWEQEGGRAGYEVEVARTGGMVRIFVDAATGQARMAGPGGGNR